MPNSPYPPKLLKSTLAAELEASINKVVPDVALDANAKPKRNPTQYNINKLGVNPTEYCYDQALATPAMRVPLEIVEAPKPKTESTAKATCKVKRVELVAELAVELVVAFVNA